MASAPESVRVCASRLNRTRSSRRWPRDPPRIAAAWTMERGKIARSVGRSEIAIVPCYQARTRRWRTCGFDRGCVSAYSGGSVLGR
jgi:hypothetical protein